MLRFSGVSKSYGNATVVPPFDLTVNSGEVLVLRGPSGCGKTTILRMVAGLVKATEGQIVVDDLVLTERSLPDVRRRLGYVIQEGGLFPHLTAAANVTLMARHQRWSRTRRDQRLAELVEMTRFPPNALTRYPIELPVMLAGIRTAAAQNVGFATLGAIIGAGGLGQPILRGIRLNDVKLILAGAIRVRRDGVHVKRKQVR